MLDLCTHTDTPNPSLMHAYQAILAHFTSIGVRLSITPYDDAASGACSRPSCYWHSAYGHRSDLFLPSSFFLHLLSLHLIIIRSAHEMSSSESMSRILRFEKQTC